MQSEVPRIFVAHAVTHIEVMATAEGLKNRPTKLMNVADRKTLSKILANKQKYYQTKTNSILKNRTL